MPSYEYKCPAHGRFDVVLSMAASSADHACPLCGMKSRKVISAPYLNLGDPMSRRVIDATKATADKPGIVTTLPTSSGRRSQQVSRDPRHQRLPKP